MEPSLALVGRQRELDECRAHLGRSRCLWIRGGPGMGKSALARALATSLDVPPPRAPATKEKNAKKGSKKKTSPAPSIVVVDDADLSLDDAEATIRAAQSSASGPRVVVTARARPRVGTVPVHVVRPLSTEETSELLQRSMEALVPGWQVRTAGEEDWMALSNRLEGCPLLVEIAATLLRDHPVDEVLALVVRGELVTARAERAPTHHASFARCIDWQLASLPPDARRALEAIAVLRSRVPYELVLRCAAESGASDPRAIVTALADASLLEVVERGARSWVSPAIAQAILANASDADRARAESTHAKVIAVAAREHAQRPRAIVTRVLGHEDLAVAALHLSSGNERGADRADRVSSADVPWVKALLDEVEVGLTTRDDPAAVGALVEALPDRLPEGHPLRSVAVLTRAGRRLLAGEAGIEPSVEATGADLGARACLFRARAAWVRGSLGAVDDAVAEGLPQARTAGLAGHAVALLTARGAAQALRGMPQAATNTLEAALEEAMTIEDDALVAHVELRLGGLAAELGRLSEASLRLEQARTLALRAGHERLAWLAECDLAVMLLEEGRFDEVAVSTAACHAKARPAWRGATVLFYRALAEELAGRPMEASRTYVRALVRARQTGNRLIEAMVHAARARLAADHDELEPAERGVVQARALFDELEDPTHGALADLSEGHIELLRARAAPAKAASSLNAVLERLTRHRAENGAVHRSFDVRIAARALEAGLESARRIRPSTPPPEPHAQSGAAVLVETSGRWFQLPFGERTSIDTRGSLRRILAGLAHDRLERPGQSRSPEGVFELGWPGERCLAESAAARVYVAISSLRKLGLRDVIRRAHDGYFFDPDLELRLVE